MKKKLYIFYINETPILIAVEKNDLNIYKLLSKKEGIDFNHQNERGNTILHSVSQFSDKELITEIMNNEKVDVNIINDKSQTPLHLAIKRENLYLASLLINNEKTNLNMIDEDGKSPLILALEYIGSRHYYYGYSSRENNEESIYEKLALLLINNDRTDLSKKDKHIS